MRKLQRRAKSSSGIGTRSVTHNWKFAVVYATSAQNKKSEAEKNLNDVNKKIG